MNRAIFLVLIIVLLWGCNKDNERRMRPVLQGFEYSECGGFKSATVTSAEAETEK